MTKGKFVAAVAMCLLASACTVPEDRAKTAVENFGMKDVHVGGWAMFGCDEKDQFTRTFTATAPSGSSVKGVVCGGWFKGETVRITN